MRLSGFLSVLLLFAGSTCGLAEQTATYGVLVYGGTPAGIAAALAAADDGESVLIVEPSAHIGGLVTSGLSHTDFHAREGLTGAYLDFAHRVEAFYSKKYGSDSRQVLDCFGGAFAEPHVNLAVFQAMLDERAGIELSLQTRLETVEIRDGSIHAATFTKAGGEKRIWAAGMFIDASYEGYPNHAADLDKVLSPTLEMRWRNIARRLGLEESTLPQADGTRTRRDWLNRAAILIK